jgi:hypothetical protein
MRPDCQRYLADPEGNESHLAECAECRVLFGDTSLDTRPLHVDALPLAPWEGAAHRAWPLVLGGILALFAAALALGQVAGLAPTRVAERSLSSMTAAQRFVMDAANVLRTASPMTQIGFVVALIAVNAALVLLLRRSPRGIDA